MTTKISWTDETWNPIVGCTKISAGCAKCYAAAAAASLRLQQFEQYQKVKDWDGTVAFVDSQLKKPFGWKSPKKIFVCSMSDLFHENISDEWRDKVFAVMYLCARHTFQVLTKRPDRAIAYFESNPWERINNEMCNLVGIDFLPIVYEKLENRLPFNIWFGITVENKTEASRRIPLLSRIPAFIRWLSIEPLLEEMHLDLTWADWVVVGGESGKGFRNMEVQWMEAIAVSCDDFKVPLFVKQDSAYQSGKQGRISEILWNRKEFPL